MPGLSHVDPGTADGYPLWGGSRDNLINILIEAELDIQSQRRTPESVK